MGDKKLTLEEALDKVEARFVHNLPADELSQIERLFFQIEQAHWFYEDFIADDPANSHLPKFKKLQSFAEVLFRRCALLTPLQDKLDVLFNDFNTYRYQIPVCGCVLVNPERTHVVLVRNWVGNSWSWPKGKINEGESALACALRETLEETGFNAAGLCTEESALVVHEDAKVTQLFVAIGVPNDTVFETQTRKEISRVEFHPLNQLPKKAWGVHQFVPKLERFLRKSKQKKGFAIAESKPKKPTTSAAFDSRNSATFGGAGEDRDWSVTDMFIANSKLTGLKFTYDGNPHDFGSRHPSYVNYREDAPLQEHGEGGGHSKTKSTEADAWSTRQENTAVLFPSKFRFSLPRIHSALDKALKDNCQR